MKKILVFGYFGFENYGDEWLLSSLLDLLTKYGDRKKVVFILYNTKNSVYRLPFVFVPRWNFVEIIRTIKKVDTVICCGGLFQDKTSVLSLLYYTGIISISEILKKTVLILGTEFNVTKVPEIFFTRVLESVDFVGVRNNTELKKLNLLSKKVKTRFFPDLCLINKLTTENRRKEIKAIGLILKKTENEKPVLQMCKKLEEKYKLVFIPFHLREDYVQCLNLMNSISKVECRVWDKVENYKNIFHEIDFVITSRFHGIIICLLLNIPFLCVSNDDKLKNFVVELNGYKYTCNTFDEFQLEHLRDAELFTNKVDLTVTKYQDIIRTNFLYFQNKNWI